MQDRGQCSKSFHILNCEYRAADQNPRLKQRSFWKSEKGCIITCRLGYLLQRNVKESSLRKMSTGEKKTGNAPKNEQN